MEQPSVVLRRKDQLSLDRELGRYYTPDDVADALVEWALGGKVGPLLDPSFGGCSFLAAGLRRMQQRANGEAPNFVHGVDLDIGARRHSEVLLSEGVPPANLRLADFLTLGADAFDHDFTCVVGNPPFIRHHWLDDEAVRVARAFAEDAGCLLPRTANSWAYFTVLSARLLAPRGRLAMLIPTSGLQADYASPVLDFLGYSFRDTKLVPLQDSLFRGTPERVTVLLADGWQEGPGGVTRHASVARTELRQALSKGIAPRRRPSEAETQGLVTRVMRQAGWVALGDVAQVAIGIVTGANHFFVRKPSELVGQQVNSDVIISTSRAFEGIVWGATDVRALTESDTACRLLDLPSKEAELDDFGRRLIQAGVAAGFDGRSHCRKRKPWWSVTDRKGGDAFLQYMASGTPRIVLNEADSLCTNAIHRLTWKSPRPNPHAVVASTCTSLFELACELRGRPYSGGVLKLEPSAAKLLPVAGKGDVVLARVDQQLREGDYDGAREIGDTSLLRHAGVGDDDIDTLRDLTVLFRRERGHGIR